MRISSSAFAVTGLSCEPPWTVNSSFVVGGKKTLVVDTGSNRLSAETIWGYASAVAPGNIIEAINTERHLDHILGNDFFRERGADIWGHASIVRSPGDLEAQIDEINEGLTNPLRRERREAALLYARSPVANPNRPISEETTFDLGGLTVEILLAPGHTESNLVVFLRDEGVLLTGDTIVAGYTPNLEAGGPEDWENWLRSLDRVEVLAPKVVVPGHGEVLFGEAIGREIGRIRKELRDAIECGEAPTKRGS